MRSVESRSTDEAQMDLGRVLKKNLFLFLLDLEVKRARRYQNFLCVLLLKVNKSSGNGNGAELESCYETLSHLLGAEMRETDIIGSLEKDQLAVLLPYADVSAGGHVKTRFEGTLKFYDFGSKGYEVSVHQISFPGDGTDIRDLLEKAKGMIPS
jgi:GGDEF domain-containing protein